MTTKTLNYNTGKLLVWGCGEFGQHGHGHQNDINISTGLSNPLLLGHDALVAKVACGSSHTVCVTEDNRIYSWGNGNSGQLGIGQSKTVFQPHTVQLGVSLGTRIDGITCGTRHSFVLTDNGECYSFGNNFSAQLGYDFRKPDFKDNQPSPVYLDMLFNKKVLQVACGSRHSLFLFNSGCIATVGSNDRGQLGTGDRNECVCIKNVPDMQDITVIGCGNCHSLAADGDGHVYVWGYGKACGLKEDVLQPMCIYECDDQIVALEGGDSHSILLTREGCVLSWGVNFEGQLGLGKQIKFQSSPEKIEQLKGKVLSVSVGENTSAATSEEGKLFMWGRNVSQVLNNDESSRYCQFYPLDIPLGSWKALTVSCGSWHVACIAVQSNMIKSPRITSYLNTSPTSTSDLSEILYKNEDYNSQDSYLGLMDSENFVNTDKKCVLDEESPLQRKDLNDISVFDEMLNNSQNEMKLQATQASQHSMSSTTSEVTSIQTIEHKIDETKLKQKNETSKWEPHYAQGSQKAMLKQPPEMKVIEKMDKTNRKVDDMKQDDSLSSIGKDNYKAPISVKEKNEKQELNRYEMIQKQQKPSSAPEHMTRELHTQNTLDTQYKLKRSQSEGSSYFKTILDLVSTTHAGCLQYSKSFNDMSALQEETSNTIYSKENTANKDLSKCSINNPVTATAVANKRQVKSDSERCPERKEHINLYSAKQTDVFTGNVSTMQLKLTGTTNGQLNRQKKQPRHLRRVPSTPEYVLPNQPLYTGHDDQLQRTQSNPNIKISGQKLDVSSTSTSPSHVPHPPSGLPPRPPGTRKPKSQKLFFSSGSSWRRRSTMK